MPNRLYALIGSPLSHSFSESYFNDFFVKEKLSDCHFVNLDFPVQRDMLAFVKLLKGSAPLTEYNKAIFEQYKDIISSLQGFCITMPYKQTIIHLLDSLPSCAKEIGAVNCVKIINENGKILLHGYNTDWIGFSLSLPKDINSQNTKALILGSGGAMRAVAYALKEKGIEYKVVSRKKHKEDNYLTYSQLTKEIVKAHNLIINTTPCGMSPFIYQRPPFMIYFLTPKHTVFDLIYNPEKTYFLLSAQEMGCKVINGLNMLNYQALENWKIWSSNTI